MARGGLHVHLLGPLSRLLARSRTLVRDSCRSAAQRTDGLGANVPRCDDRLGIFPIQQHGAGPPLLVDDERIFVWDGRLLRPSVVSGAAERIFYPMRAELRALPLRAIFDAVGWLGRKDELQGHRRCRNLSLLSGSFAGE